MSVKNAYQFAGQKTCDTIFQSISPDKYVKRYRSQKKDDRANVRVKGCAFLTGDPERTQPLLFSVESTHNLRIGGNSHGS